MTGLRSRDGAEEWAAYLARKPQLLRECPGRFVVFVGGEMIGTCPTRGEAFRAGFRQFGGGPMLIKQVQEREPMA